MQTPDEQKSFSPIQTPDDLNNFDSPVNTPEEAKCFDVGKTPYNAPLMLTNISYVTQKTC